AGMHRKRLRKFDPCAFLCIEQIKKRSFLCMIGTGRITGGGTDAAIFFTDEISIRQLFVAPKAPSDASFFMQIFGERTALRSRHRRGGRRENPIAFCSRSNNSSA